MLSISVSGRDGVKLVEGIGINLFPKDYHRKRLKVTGLNNNIKSILDNILFCVFIGHPDISRQVTGLFHKPQSTGVLYSS